MTTTRWAVATVSLMVVWTAAVLVQQMFKGGGVVSARACYNDPTCGDVPGWTPWLVWIAGLVVVGLVALVALMWARRH